MLEGIKLLAVDDEQMSLEMLSAMMTSQGVACLTASDGRESLSVLAAHPETEIMLLDIQMPGMDGLEVIRQCRQNPCLKDLPIIVISADHVEKLQALKLGANDYLTKPFHMEELELRVSKLVMSHRKTRCAKKAKDEFLSVASHELRTPMHKIIGLSELLGDGMIADDLRQECISNLKDATWELTGTIKNILDYARLDYGAGEAVTGEFSIRAIVQDALDQLQEAALANGNRLILEIEGGMNDTVDGTPYYLHRSLTSLVQNAVKFSSGGDVTITINKQHQGRVHSRYSCRVSDHGRGIPAEFHERIFEPFFQVDYSSTREHGGMGLGLALAKRMVELMGGAIAVRSEPGGGSSFTFTFFCRNLQTDRID